MNTMRIWRRWQDWMPLVLGVLLISVPLVFGMTVISTHSWNAWVLGAVVGVVAMALAALWLGFASNGLTEGVTMMLGTVLIITPWAMGLSPLSVGTWASCILGTILVLAAGGVSAKNWNRQAAFPTTWGLRRGLVETGTRDGYRRSNQSYVR